MNTVTMPGLREALAVERAADRHVADLVEKLGKAKLAVAAAQDARSAVVAKIAAGHHADAGAVEVKIRAAEAQVTALVEAIGLAETEARTAAGGVNDLLRRAATERAIAARTAADAAKEQFKAAMATMNSAGARSMAAQREADAGPDVWRAIYHSELEHAAL